MNIFDHLKNLTQYKKDADFSDDETASSYKRDRRNLNRYISMIDVFVEYVNEINRLPNISDEMHYRYFFNLLPQRNIYFKWIKKTKDSTDEEIRYIAHYYNVGLKEAKLYYNNLSREEIDDIINIYRYGKNKIAKVD